MTPRPLRFWSSSWIFGALLVTVVLSPLPFGSVYQWSWAGIAVIVGGLLLLWTVGAVFTPDYMARSLDRVWLPGLLYLFCLAWVFLQGSDLTPERWHHSIWSETSNTLNGRTSGSISLDPYDSESSFLQMLAFAGIFWLSAQSCRAPNRARAGLWTLGTAGALYALYGMMAEPGTLLWISTTSAREGFLTGPFINRNMYAFFAALAFLCIAGLLLDWMLSFIDEGETFSESLKTILRLNPARLFTLCIILLVLLVSIGLTGSRGGAISLTISFGVLLVCLLRSKKTMVAKSRWMIIGLAATLMVLVYGLAGFSLGKRFQGEILEVGGRWDGYKLTMSAIEDAPWQGFGSGTFPDVYFLYSNGSSWNDLNYSHNLYLGSVTELGLPAAAALFAAVVLVLFSCLRGLKRRRRDHLFPALGVAAGILLAIHGLGDSPLFVPANAVTFSFLLGLAYAQSWSTEPAST